MPYDITYDKRTRKWLLRKRSTGKVVSRHGTRGKALSAIRAIEANKHRKR